MNKKKVFTIALIGSDGAGKTTVARRLVRSLPWPSKYLYTGLSVQSSDKPLPTSLLVRNFRRWFYTNGLKKNGMAKSPHNLNHESKRRGTLWLTARFLNRMAEIWWRQLLAWIYQLQGYIVVHDRHFLFETIVDLNEDQEDCFFDRLEYWIVNHIYPRPDMVIMLRAPAEVLYARKGEGGLEFLEKRGELMNQQEKNVSHLETVDASQPLEQVMAEVTRHIHEFQISRSKS